MKQILSAIILLIVLKMNAQDTKGFTTPTANTSQQVGKTYALIVGISDYKNERIPDLQYADKDAVAFRNYLVETGVDSTNITILLNEKATYAEIWSSLYMLLDLAKAGDKIFLYFSGHGDVDTRLITKDAYLLTYDANPQMYSAFCIDVNKLKGHIATFSSESVQVIFIADACRSGNLIGGLAGMESTAATLGDKWTNEVKILSCQPGEYSLEGVEWGKGRGLFSFELIRGLSGMADRNKDQSVSLYELNLYLSEKIPEEAEPIPQFPMLSGNMQLAMSRVNDETLASLTKEEFESNLMSQINPRGIEESLLKGLPDSIAKHYNEFKKFLDLKVFERQPKFKSLGSAIDSYNMIPENESTKMLKALMKRNLCAGIMADTNRGLEMIMTNRLPELIAEGADSTVMSGCQLLRELLGDKKLRDMGFMAKAYFGEGLDGLGNSGEMLDDSISFSKAMLMLDSGLVIDGSAAYIPFMKGLLYDVKDEENNASLNYRKALDINPRFITARDLFSFQYSGAGKLDSAIYLFDELFAFDSTNCLLVYGSKVNFYTRMQQPDSTKKYIDLYVANYSDSLEHKGAFNRNLIIGLLSRKQRDYEIAIRFLEKAIDEKEDVESPAMFHYWISCSHSSLGNTKSALSYLEKSLQGGLIDIAAQNSDNASEKIMNEPELKKLRKTKDFKALMKKYFPDNK